MKKKILFTGGSGLLAINWAWHISNSYDVVLGVHNRKITVPGIEITELHLDTAAKLLADLEQIQPDMVIHCAGLANVEQCETQPELAHFVNVVLSENVATACKQQNIELVYICTDHLFSGNRPLVTEEETVTPVNVYGRTKYEGEYAVLSVDDSFLSIRTNFYGWGTSYRHSFSDMIIRNIRDGKSVSLFEDFFYTPILIEDLSDAVMQLPGKASGIFNVVGNERVSKLDFGLRLASQFGLDQSCIQASRISERKDLVKRPAELSLSNQKVETLLGKRVGDIGQNINRLYRQEQEGMAKALQTI